MKSYFKSCFSMFICAILAGICIGVAGAVYLKISGTFVGSDIIGALMFSVGLFAICTRGYSLFTGSACQYAGYGVGNIPVLIIDLIGNFVGTLLIALLLKHTSLCGVSGIDVAATSIVSSKMDSSYLNLFLLGIVCNIFIFIAVRGYKKASDRFEGIFAIILGVSCFVILGSEHSIADMFYWAISGILYSNFRASISRILIIALGNAVGGIVLSYIEKYVNHLNEDIKNNAIVQNLRKDVMEDIKEKIE